MVLDFITVTAFFLLCAYKLGLFFFSVAVSVIPYLKTITLFKKTATQVKALGLGKAAGVGASQIIARVFSRLEKC